MYKGVSITFFERNSNVLDVSVRLDSHHQVEVEESKNLGWADEDLVLVLEASLWLVGYVKLFETLQSLGVSDVDAPVGVHVSQSNIFFGGGVLRIDLGH